MEFLKELFFLVGRVLISGMFLWGAYERITNWHAVMTHLKTKHIPQAEIVMPVSVALKVIGGLSVLFGWYAHIGALLLLIIAIPSLLTIRTFWTLHGTERTVEKHLFMREVAVIGGLFLLLALGAGRFSIGG